MSKTKKIILLVSMVVVLAVAAYLNIMLLSKKSGENGGGDVQSTSTFFNTCREDRDTARKEEIANLDAIINVEGDEYETARANAVAQKQTIVKAMEMEMLLENLLKAKGFEKAIAVIGDSGINIVVKSEGLTSAQTLQIQDIITAETNISLANIKIVPVK